MDTLSDTVIWRGLLQMDDKLQRQSCFDWDIETQNWEPFARERQ